MNRPDYASICFRHGIELQWGAGEENDRMVNRSCCYGRDVIAIGEYVDLECEIISFFHELGHCISAQEHCLPPYENWPYHHFAEAVAWKLGLRLAADEGIEFSENALEYAREQLSTYFLDDHPEHSPTRHLPFALRTAGLISFTTLVEAVADRLFVLGLEIDLATDDPFWMTHQFPSEVKEKLRAARTLWGEATNTALKFAEQEFS